MTEKTTQRLNDTWQIQKSTAELTLGFDKMRDVKKCVTFFGSARLKPDTLHYKLAEDLAFKLSEIGYGVITGGGGGIMEAGNKGAHDGGAKSIGIGIRLPFEVKNNEYIENDNNLVFDYFYIRKVLLVKYSDFFVCFAGGLGTIDELMEVATLMQTQKIEKKKIYLVDSNYWNGLISWLKDTVYINGCISKKDFDLFTIVDDVNVIINDLKLK